MRNLKKVLSLALALVMMLGMMVVGAGATEYTDAGSIDTDYKAAADVTGAIKVILGRDTGAFDPKATLNRAEGAAIIYRLITGGIDKDPAPVPTGFVDVDGSSFSWASGYIAACAQQDILSGVGGNYFDPAGRLTGYAFGKMLLVALGYNPDIQGYTGESWGANVFRDAYSAGINVSGVNMANELSREQAAQMTLQALTATMVDQAADISVNGVVISGGKPTARLNNNANSNYLLSDAGTNDGYLQLCELYFPNLKLDTRSSVSDDMNRPAQNWILSGETIATSASTPAWSTVVTSAQTAAKLVGDHNGNWTKTGSIASINGDTKTTAAAANLLVGDEVDVYLTAGTTTVSAIVVTRYSVKEVTGSATTRGSGSSLEVRIPGFVGYTAATDLDGEYADLENGDVVYYYQDSEDVYHFAKADSFEGTLTGTRSGGYIINGDTRYINGNVGTITDVNGTPVYNTTYEYFTDPNNYLIAAKAVEEAASKDYVVIQDIKCAQGTGGITGASAVEARLVKMDGTTEVVKVKSVVISGTTYTGINASGAPTGTQLGGISAGSGSVIAAVTSEANKAFFTFNINSDNEYELTKATDTNLSQAALASDTEIKNGSASMDHNAGVAVSRNTVFVVANTSGGTSFKVYNGINEVPNIVLEAANNHNLGAYVAENGIATYVYVGSFKSSDVSGDGVFFLKDTHEAFMSEKVDGSNIYYKTYKAIVDGKSDVVKIKTNSVGTLGVDVSDLTIGLFTPTYDANGLITKITANASGEAVATGYTLSGNTLVTNVGAYTCANDALAFVTDTSVKSVTDGTADSIKEKDDNDLIYVVKAGSGKVDFVVIKEVDDDTKTAAVNTPGAAASFDLDIAPAIGDKGSDSAVISGTVKAGIPTNGADDKTDAEHNLDMGTSMDGVEITTSFIEMPVGSYGIRQTNNLFNDSVKFPSANGFDNSAKTKTKAYTVGTGGDNYWFMIEPGKTVTIEFDWDYTGTGKHATFEPDYTITISANGLVIKP